jgi:undecaprenyl-diphosphatase
MTGSLVLAGLAALGLSVAAIMTDRFPGDLPIALWVQSFATPWLDQVAETLAAAGRTLPNLLILLAFSVGLAIQRLRREGVWLFLTVMATFLLGLALKALVARPRPDHVDLRVLFDETTKSFPSGHALYTTALCAALFYLATVHMTPSPITRVLQGVLVIVPIALGGARIYLGVHWPSDILGSFVIGTFLVGLAAIVFLPNTGSVTAQNGSDDPVGESR